MQLYLKRNSIFTETSTKRTSATQLENVPHLRTTLQWRTHRQAYYHLSEDIYQKEKDLWCHQASCEGMASWNALNPFQFYMECFIHSLAHIALHVNTLISSLSPPFHSVSARIFRLNYNNFPFCFMILLSHLGYRSRTICKEDGKTDCCDAEANSR